MAKYTVFLRREDRVFSFLNSPKNLDLFYKVDLGLWDCLGRVKDGSRSLGLFWKGKILVSVKFHRTDLVICCHSGEGKNPSYS